MEVLIAVLAAVMYVIGCAICYVIFAVASVFDSRKKISLEYWLVIFTWPVSILIIILFGIVKTANRNVKKW